MNLCFSNPVCTLQQVPNNNNVYYYTYNIFWPNMAMISSFRSAQQIIFIRSYHWCQPIILCSVLNNQTLSITSELGWDKELQCHYKSSEGGTHILVLCRECMFWIIVCMLNITICEEAVITVAVSLGLVGVPEMATSQGTGRYALLVYIVGFSCHVYRVYIQV